MCIYIYIYCTHTINNKYITLFYIYNKLKTLYRHLLKMLLG